MLRNNPAHILPALYLGNRFAPGIDSPVLEIGRIALKNLSPMPTVFGWKNIEVDMVLSIPNRTAVKSIFIRSSR